MSDLCNRCKVTKDTVRYYHRFGLLDEAIKQNNGYGLYTKEHEEKVMFIRKLQSFGFSLKEIKSAITLEETGNLSDKIRIDTLSIKLSEVENKIEALKDYKKSLIKAISHLKNNRQML